MKKDLILGRIGNLCLSISLVILAGCASNVPAPVVDRSGQLSSMATGPDTYTVKSGDTIYSIAREHGIDFRELIALNGIENPNQIAVGNVLKVRPAATDAQTETAVTAPVTSDDVVVQPIGGEEPLAGNLPQVGSDGIKREPRAGKEPYSEQALAAAQSQVQTPEPTKAEPPATVTGSEQKTEPQPSVATPSNDAATAWAWPAGGKLIGTFGQNGNKGIDIAGRKGDPVVAAGDGKVIHSGSALRGYGKLIIIKHDNTYISAYAHNDTILVKDQQTVKKGQKIAEIGNTDTNQYKLHFEVRQQGKPVDPLKFLPSR